MSFQYLKLFQQVELDIETEGPMLFEFSTDLPGDVQAVRKSQTFDTSATAGGRLAVNIRMPGACKGRHCKARISGNYVVRLFGARVFQKVLGTPTPTGWEWKAIPVDITADLFSDFKLPIPPTASEFAQVKLPIPATASEFTTMNMPVRPSDLLFEWVDLTMDAIE
jgi:hypothetical protein